MAGCKVNSEASPQFKHLREHWKRKGFPKISDDLTEAFSAISQNILAANGARVQAGPIVEIYKYRQNSKDIKRGSRYGWRIIALFHKSTETMYPIIVYPKTAWENAGDKMIAEAIQEIRQILGYCISSDCDGMMAPGNPPEQKRDGETVHIKMRCQKCGSIQWAIA